MSTALCNLFELHLYSTLPVSYCLDINRIASKIYSSDLEHLFLKSIGCVFFFSFSHWQFIDKIKKNDSQIRMSQGEGIERK